MYIGSCLCGGVQLTISGKISNIIHCHCSLCRKSTGSAFATNGFVNAADFTVTQGQQLLNHFTLKSGRQRYFCRICASPIYSANTADPARIRIRLGILDSEIAEKPISHNFVTSKANWDSLDINLPQYEAHEPGRK